MPARTTRGMRKPLGLTGRRGFGALRILHGYWTVDRRELLAIKHKQARAGGGARRPWRWRGPRWLLYPPRR